MKNETCPCCSGKDFADCCKPLVMEGQAAKTPLALMRSRYTAHYYKNMPYILRTMVGKTPDAERDAARKERFEQCQWNKLEILDAPEIAASDETGIVEFNAYFTLHGVQDVLHERSRFIKKDGQWYYVAN